MQIDNPERGFSFLKEGVLDMRMDNTSEDISAAEIVNNWSENDLGGIFRDLGEEPRWRKAAKAIVTARKKKRIKTTTELAEVVVEALGRIPGKRIHPATLVFQALRMCVNKELESVQMGIQKALHILSPGGRIGALSFHSLEDAVVKNVLREAAKPIDKSKEALIKILTKKPLIPTAAEIRANPRSRSAKLRFAEKE